MDHSVPVSEGIPRKRHPGAEEPFGVIFREGRIADPRDSHKHAVRIGNEVSSPSRLLVPAGVEFVAKTYLNREIVPQLDSVLHVPCADQASPTQLFGLGHGLQACSPSLAGTTAK